MNTSSTDLFDERDRLEEIARAILPTAGEAERAVDLTFSRWLALPPEERAATGSRRERLTEILARICLDRLGWVPHRSAPAVPGTSTTPADRVTLDDSMYMLLLVVLDSLAPEERVAFILHDVFGVGYHGISEVVGRSPDAARELARSARRQVQQQRQREAPPDRHRDVVLALLRAVRAGDERAVRRLLHDDVIALVDSGGRADGSPAPTSGAERVARRLLRLAALLPGVTVEPQPVNGRLGLVARQGTRVVGIVSVGVAADAIRDIWIVLAPDKLRTWNP